MDACERFWTLLDACERLWTSARLVSVLIMQGTDSIKINRPRYNIRMYWANFWQPTIHVQQNIFEKNLIEVSIPYIYASFGTFCVQIGQLLAAQWVFKHSKEFRNRRHFPSIAAICRFPNVPRKIAQFGRKRCQKKRKDMNKKLRWVFSKIFCYI